MLWLFRYVTLQMQKVRREMVGRTRGVSIRICKGVYYRTGGFRGHLLLSRLEFYQVVLAVPPF